MPLPVLATYALMSVVALVAHGVDKSAARRGGRRIPERTLYLIALLGGFPGTLLAIGVFRHKSRKASFTLIVSLIALIHAAGWAWWARARLL